MRLILRSEDMLIYIIVFWIPPLISANLTHKLQRHEKISIDFLKNFALYSCLILCINSFFLCTRGWGDFAFERLSAQFILKYLTCSLFLAYLLPYSHFYLDWLIGRFITGKYKPKF